MTDLDNRVRILESSRDQRELQTTAQSLAASPRSADLQLIESKLVDADFLNRLDSTSDRAVKTLRFGEVIKTLGGNTAPEVGKMLQRISVLRSIGSDSERMNHVLVAAAMQRPMPEDRREVFRIANLRDHLLLNMHLLAQNGSPNALLELQRELLAKPPEIRDSSVISLMHRVFVSRRTQVEFLNVAVELVGKVSKLLEIGLYESFFDYQYERWYGSDAYPPEPPTWDSADDPALKVALQLIAMGRSAELPDRLRSRLELAAAEIGQLARSRRIR